MERGALPLGKGQKTPCSVFEGKMEGGVLYVFRSKTVVAMSFFAGCALYDKKIRGYVYKSACFISRFVKIYASLPMCFCRYLVSNLTSSVLVFRL